MPQPLGSACAVTHAPCLRSLSLSLQSPVNLEKYSFFCRFSRFPLVATLSPPSTASRNIFLMASGSLAKPDRASLRLCCMKMRIEIIDIVACLRGAGSQGRLEHVVTR
ncbi:hypothetical protein PENSPDRAFT_168013 [Peniophora sp. CONT]|nr:hypothetical protein PENSPDRAFT_168013 [Peniophora sp. CONT]